MNPTPPTHRPPTQPPSATDPVIGRPARAWVGRRPDTSVPAADDSFDALTDLFMGEAASAKSAGSAQNAGATRDAGHTVPAASIASARPVLRLAGGGDDEVAAVVPVATTPAAAPAPRRVERDVGEPVVECLSLSNLPVLASAWASQYVREISAAAGRPVAVLRVQAGFASVEVIGEWAGEAGLPGVEPVDDLAAALRIAAGITDRWIVRCSTSEQRDLAGRGLIRVLTVLTGADEAAAAAAMQAVDTVGSGLPESGGPMVRLAVMGVVDEHSTAAGRSLAAAAESRLGRPVQQVVCSSKIRSARAPLSLFSGAVGQELPAITDLLEGVLGIDRVATPPALLAGISHEPKTVEAARPSTTLPTINLEASPMIPAEQHQATQLEPEWEPTLPDATSIPLTSDGLDDVPLPAAEISTPFAAPMAEGRQAVGSGVASLMPWLGEPSAGVDAPAEAEVRVAAPAAQTAWAAAPAARSPEPPEPAAAQEIRAAASDSADLWTFVPGLSGTRIRCPYAQGVEFGVDDSGSLHLLARAASERSQDTALADLLVAASWASAHASLLGSQAPKQRPVMHVFTDQPKRSRRLLDTDVRVHVLAPVSIGTKTAWYYAELN